MKNKRYYFIVYNNDVIYYLDFVESKNLEIAKKEIELKHPNANRYELCDID